MLLEQLPVDARLVVVALQVAGRGQLDQVRVARVRLGQQRQVRVTLLLRPPVVGDIALTADQRLDALLGRLPVELDRAGQRAVVGERDRRHLELRGPRHERRNAAGPVEDRVLGVDVQVNEGRLGQSGAILGTGWDAIRPGKLGYLEMAKQISKPDKTSMVIDREKAARAKEILGTTTLAETVDKALEQVLSVESRVQLFQRLIRDGGIGPSPEELNRLREPRKR